MENESSADASVVADIDAQINVSGGAKATLDASVQAAASTDVIIDAYTTFYSAVESTVKSHLQSAGSAEVDATTQVMILINTAT